MKDLGAVLLAAKEILRDHVKEGDVIRIGVSEGGLAIVAG